MELAPSHKTGTPENPKTLYEFWDIEAYVEDEHSKGDAKLKRVERGPIYNSFGGVKRDWDPLNFTPLIMWGVTPHFNLSTYDVFTGNLIGKLKRALMPRQVYDIAVDKTNVKKGLDLASKANDISGAMTEAMVWEGHRSKFGAEPVARKHQVFSDRYKDYMDGKLDLRTYYTDKAAKKGS